MILHTPQNEIHPLHFSYPQFMGANIIWITGLITQFRHTGICKYLESIWNSQLWTQIYKHFLRKEDIFKSMFSFTFHITVLSQRFNSVLIHTPKGARTVLHVIPVSVSEQCLQPTFNLRTVKFVFQSKYNVITIHKLKCNPYPYVNYKVFHNSSCKMLWTMVCCNSISTTGIQKCWLQTLVTQGNIPSLFS